MKKRKTYNEAAVKDALAAVKSGVPINTASKEFNIPRMTLHDKMKKKDISNTPGPTSIISEADENRIVEWILFMSTHGNPVTKEHLLNSVGVSVKKLNISTPFNNGRPDRHWYESFLRRHPQLKVRMCENVSLSRALVSEDNVKLWFNDIVKYFKKEKLQDVDASRIFNSDETSLLLNPKGGSVLAKKG